MAFSVGGIGNLGFSTVRPMNYAVDNKADVSQAFTESVSKPAPSSLTRVDASNPVGYANAQSVQVDQTARLKQSQAINREYNDIAATFLGAVTGYQPEQTTTGYAMPGSSFDVYA